ncbi:hypothetical protein F4604DRAFT_1683955 [Suillus subluteus]|nr:hypothetical protein F4604DRAFT_1683955 [Suillus subluteus]
MVLVDDYFQWWMLPLSIRADLYSYFIAASSAAVVYDWALTFGQEFELILDGAIDSGQSQRWTFVTVLYICVRYIGILYSVYVCEAIYIALQCANQSFLATSTNILGNFPIISITDQGCTIVWYIQMWTPFIVNAMLGVIMIARIYAMYQGSKKLLIFLVVALLTCTIGSGFMMGLKDLASSPGVQETHGHLADGVGCSAASAINLNFLSMIFTTVWEIIALFLTVQIVMKHFRELRQLLTGSTAGDCFRILVESHAFYFLASAFASFVTVACFTLGSLSLMGTISMGSTVYSGILSIAEALQMFVLGPRLVLSIREHHAKVVARADEGTGMTTIAFHAGGDESTGRDV